MSSQLTKHNGKIWLCDGCLQRFLSESKLELHKKLGCQKALIELPAPENKYLKFKNVANQLSVPFVIYADFESILSPLQTVAENKNTFYSHKHIPCSFAYYIHCNYDDSLSKFVLYRGEDCVEKFVDNIYSDARRIADVYSNKIMCESSDALLNTASHCHICGQPFLAMEQKVVDHCHLTGKIRGAAHQQSIYIKE